MEAILSFLGLLAICWGSFFIILLVIMYVIEAIQKFSRFIKFKRAQKKHLKQTLFYRYSSELNRAVLVNKKMIPLSYEELKERKLL